MYFFLSLSLHSMVLQNHNTVVARSTLTPNSSSQNFGSHHGGQSLGLGRPLGGGSSGPSNQRPIVDLLVAMVAVPVLILCALQLEKNLHEMHESPESRWLVFALGIGMLLISIIICGYVTHRMGVCIWAGPIDEAGNRAGNGALPHVSIVVYIYTMCSETHSPFFCTNSRSTRRTMCCALWTRCLPAMTAWSSVICHRLHTIALSSIWIRASKCSHKHHRRMTPPPPQPANKPLPPVPYPFPSLAPLCISESLRRDRETQGETERERAKSGERGERTKEIFFACGIEFF